MKIYDQNKQKRQNHSVILPLLSPDQRAELGALEIWEEKINRKSVPEVVIISTGYEITLGIDVSTSKRVVKIGECNHRICAKNPLSGQSIDDSKE